MSEAEWIALISTQGLLQYNCQMTLGYGLCKMTKAMGLVR